MAVHIYRYTLYTKAVYSIYTYTGKNNTLSHVLKAYSHKIQFITRCKKYKNEKFASTAHTSTGAKKEEKKMTLINLYIPERWPFFEFLVNLSIGLFTRVYMYYICAKAVIFHFISLRRGVTRKLRKRGGVTSSPTKG